MGSFTISDSMELPDFLQEVYLNGARRSDMICLRVETSEGINGARATFEVPERDWDADSSDLFAQFVLVRCGMDGYIRTIFCGYLTTSNGRLNANTLEVEAVSAMGLADHIFIGEDFPENGMVCEYPERAFYNSVLREPTGWTVKTILRDWFSGADRTWRGGGGSIHQQWRTRLKLGSLAVLSTYWNTFPIGDQAFTRETLRGGVQRLIGLLSTIGVREEFRDSGVTVLQFYEISTASRPVREMIVAPRGTSVRGSNVYDVTNEKSMLDSCTRLYAYGGQRKFVVSVATDHETSPLEKLWNPNLETQVLENPERTKKGAESGQSGDESRQEFTEAHKLVFRKYRLPECLRRMLIEKDNAIENSGGETLPIQVWKSSRILFEFEEGFTSIQAPVPELLSGWDFDPKTGEILLAEPAINFAQGEVDSNGIIVDDYLEAVVGITLTVAGDHLLHDTGVRRNGLDIPFVGGAGIPDVIHNDSFQFVQVTNIGYPLKDYGGVEHTFGQVWVNLGGNTWQEWTTAEVLKDHSKGLQIFADGSLRERAGLKNDYAIETPYQTFAYRVGDRIELVGVDNTVVGVDLIRTATHDLTRDHKTMLATDNSIPQLMTMALEGDKK